MRNFFTWHIWPRPRNIKIQSVYEILMLLGVFGVCLYLYLKGNEVKMYEYSFQVECLDNRDKNGDFKNYEVSITLRIPYTKVKKLAKEANDTLSGNFIMLFSPKYIGQYCFSKTKPDSLIRVKDKYILLNQLASNCSESLKPSDAYNRSIEYLGLDTLYIKNPNRYKYADFYTPVNYDVFLVNEVNLRSNKRWNSKVNPYSEISALNKLFEEISDTLLTEHRDYHPLFYYNLRLTPSQKQSNSRYVVLDSVLIQKNTWNKGDKEIFLFEEDKVFEATKGFLFNDKNNNNECFAHAFSAQHITRPPGWFSLRDISQAYFKINLKSESIDSINLKIDFDGATDFSQIYPAPDKVSMSSIEYHEFPKLNYIKYHGIVFHAHFKEFANMQSIRMFFLTAIMSALFTVIIVFLILAFYKVPVSLRKRMLKKKTDAASSKPAAQGEGPKEDSSHEEHPESDASQEEEKSEEMNQTNNNTNGKSTGTCGTAQDDMEDSE